MPLWLQNILVLLAVLACIAIVARQMWSTLAGKKSRLGNCCARGCPTTASPQSRSTQRIVFLPSEMLRKRR